MMRKTGIHLPTTLRFVESDERYSVYRTRDGEEVYLAHGTGKQLVELGDRSLADWWNEWVATNSRYDSAGFHTWLRESILEPDDADEIEFCSDCSTPDYADDQYSTNNGNVCESCRENYYTCDSCEERFRHTTTTLHDTEACDRCLSNYWSWCEDCEGYYRDEDSGDHHHDGSGCCESPAQSFTIRNDGELPLANDTRVTVTLPAGHISDEGIDAIYRYLRDYSYELAGEEGHNVRQVAFKLTELGEMWQTREGNYTKRLSRLAYKSFGLKLKPEVVSRVGCIARDHSTAIDFQIETTRDLNQSASDFAHEESCWWQSYSESRCALKTNGGFGLRTFTDAGWVNGRAWVIPLKLTESGRLTPTFETLEPDAFVVFNGYGDLGGYVPARIISHMAGMTYRKVDFTCSPMYVNSSSGYLVAPEEIADGYTDGCLSLSVNQHSSLFESEKRVLTYA